MSETAEQTLTAIIEPAPVWLLGHWGDGREIRIGPLTEAEAPSVRSRIYEVDVEATVSARRERPYWIVRLPEGICAADVQVTDVAPEDVTGAQDGRYSLTQIDQLLTPLVVREWRAGIDRETTGESE